MTIEEYQERVDKVFGNGVYTILSFTKIKDPISYTCKRINECGNEKCIFRPNANNFLHSKGCPRNSNSFVDTDILKEIIFKRFGNTIDTSITVFTNRKGNIKFICSKHGEREQRAETFLTGEGCNLCYRESRRMTRDQFIEQMKQIHGDKFLPEEIEFNGYEEKGSAYCHIINALGNEHGRFPIDPNDFLSGKGCPYCTGKYKTTELWIAEMKQIWPDGLFTFDNTVYINARTKLKVTCIKHGDFPVTPHDFGKLVGCPICNMPKMELMLWKYFQDNNIENIHGYTPDWLKKNGKTNPQHLDFYLPEKNFAIECDGVQHFEPRELFGGEEGFLDIQERDKRKQRLCDEHNVSIEHIRYDEDTIEALEKILEKYGMLPKHNNSKLILKEEQPKPVYRSLHVNALTGYCN